MKKKIILFLLSALAVCLTACGKDKTTEGAEASDSTSVEAEEEDTFSASSDVHEPVSFADLTSTVVNLGEYKGIEAVRMVEEVTDEDVESEVRAIKEDYGQLVDVDRPAQMGDVVTIDYTGYVDGETSDALQGEEHPLELGSGGFVPGFEEQLVGVEAGTECEVDLTFPEDYYEDVAGKEAHFDVRVERVSIYEVEGWGDDFIQENLGYECEADMRAAIREELEVSAEEDADSRLEYDLVMALIDGSEFDVQETDVEVFINEMVSEYETYAAMYQMTLEEYLENFQMTEEQLRDMYRDTADFRVRMVLVLQAVASAEQMEVTDEECQTKIEELAEEYGYSDPADVEAVYSRDLVKEQMLQERALVFIRENAVIS